MTGCRTPLGGRHEGRRCGDVVQVHVDVLSATFGPYKAQVLGREDWWTWTVSLDGEGSPGARRRACFRLRRKRASPPSWMQPD